MKKLIISICLCMMICVPNIAHADRIGLAGIRKVLIRIAVAIEKLVEIKEKEHYRDYEYK